MDRGFGAPIGRRTGVSTMGRARCPPDLDGRVCASLLINSPAQSVSVPVSSNSKPSLARRPGSRPGSPGQARTRPTSAQEAPSSGRTPHECDHRAPVPTGTAECAPALWPQQWPRYPDASFPIRSRRTADRRQPSQSQPRGPNAPSSYTGARGSPRRCQRP